MKKQAKIINQVCVCVCVRAHTHVCVRACVRVCVHACVIMGLSDFHFVCTCDVHRYGVGCVNDFVRLSVVHELVVT